MLRGLGRIAPLALVLALAVGLVGCVGQYGKLQAKRCVQGRQRACMREQEYKRAAVLYEEAITNDPGAVGGLLLPRQQLRQPVQALGA